MSRLFPGLVGQGWSVHKKPKFDVRVAPHATGREARAGKYATPMWEFELTFDGLDMTATGDYGALGAQSMQTLAGFFLQMQGKANPFVYVDPTDCLVVNGQVGVGDGVTTTFTMTRPMGAYSEPVGALVSVSAMRMNGTNIFGWTVAQPNVLTFGTPPPPGAVITADFKFGYACRFSEDLEDFEEFMAMLSGVKTLTFQSVRDIVPLEVTALRTIIIAGLVTGEFCAPSDWNNNYNRVIAIGGGASGGFGVGRGGGGGAYTYRDNVQLDVGQCVPIYVGEGGAAGTSGGANGIPGGATSFHNEGDPNYVYAENGGLSGGVVFSGEGGRAGWCIPGPPNARSGGNGAPGAFNFFGAGANGGGGAGGPFGDGGNGGGATDCQGGAGGGGADGGGNGADAVSATGAGGQGGSARDGTPGGATYFIAGHPGDPGANGSGGGGGCSGYPPNDHGSGGDGSTEPIWFLDGTWYGPGSGGGGAGGYGGLYLAPNNGNGGNGGKFGGGGGGGGAGADGTPGQSGEGGVGALIIIYLGVESST